MLHVPCEREGIPPAGVTAEGSAVLASTLPSQTSYGGATVLEERVDDQVLPVGTNSDRVVPEQLAKECLQAECIVSRASNDHDDVVPPSVYRGSLAADLQRIPPEGPTERSGLLLVPSGHEAQYAVLELGRA